MRKLSFLFLGTVLSVGFLGQGLCVHHVSAAETTVYVGGISAGFTLKSGEVQVIGLCEVLTNNGVQSPAAQAGLRCGDRLKKVAGIAVDDIESLNEIVGKCGGKSIDFEIERGNERLNLTIQPVKDKTSEKYKIGILARDNVSGIGTVTYINKETSRFGSLGHTVVRENREPLKISKGTVYECSIVGVQKGVRGKAGELRGMFLSDKQVGTAEKLCDCGIFGTVSNDFDYQNMQTVIASSDSATMGKAFIYSTINGIAPKKYEIEIVKVDKNNKENKNYVIKITDDDLIEETGGIVQGMSGSPIIQNGKMIGAVTHVFVNDPTRGYGIDIQTMLKE